MSEDPRAILKAEGVECPELEDYLETRCIVPHKGDVAILALVRLAIEYKNEADERERIMHGQTNSGYVTYLGQIGPGDIIVGGGGGGASLSDPGGRGGYNNERP